MSKGVGVLLVAEKAIAAPKDDWRALRQFGQQQLARKMVNFAPETVAPGFDEQVSLFTVFYRCPFRKFKAVVHTVPPAEAFKQTGCRSIAGVMGEQPANVYFGQGQVPLEKELSGIVQEDIADVVTSSGGFL